MGSIYLKTQEEIEIMKDGGVRLASVLKELIGMAVPGANLDDLDAHAKKALGKHGSPAFLGYHGFPNAVCFSRNQEVVHGMAHGRILEDGDIIGMDIGLKRKGFVTDMAVTVPVGEVEDEAKQLMRVTQDALKNAIETVRSGAKIGDIGAAVMKTVEPYGYGIVRDLVGHGIGENLHEDPSVPNFGKAGEGIALEEGLVIAVEPMITAGGSHKVKTLDDDWTVETKDGSLAAHFEHTIAVTEGGYDLITAFDTGFSYE